MPEGIDGMELLLAPPAEGMLGMVDGMDGIEAPPPEAPPVEPDELL